MGDFIVTPDKEGGMPCQKCQTVWTMCQCELDNELQAKDLIISEQAKEIEVSTQYSLGWEEAYKKLSIQNSELKEEVDKLRVQLAGCGVEALGYGKDCKPDDYGWSASFGDVRNLRERFEALSAHLELCRTALMGGCALNPPDGERHEDNEIFDLGSGGRERKFCRECAKEVLAKLPKEGTP